MLNNQSFGDSDLQYYLANRDNRSFRKLVDYYYEKIYFLAFSQVNDHEYATGIANETFAKFYKADPKLEHPHQLYAYLRTVARNLCSDHLDWGKRNRTSELDDDTVENIHDDPDTTDETAYEEILQALMEHVQRLPEQQKRVIELMLYEGLSVEEAAEVMKISSQTARNHKARAIANLKHTPLAKRLLPLLCIFLESIQ